MTELEQMRRQHRDSNTFDVVCSFPNRERLRLLRSMLHWDEANGLAEELQRRFAKAHPNKSSWTSRLYSVRLHQKTVQKACAVCGVQVSGKAVYCSCRCRQVASRKRRHSSGSGTVTDKVA